MMITSQKHVVILLVVLILLISSVFSIPSPSSTKKAVSSLLRGRNKHGSGNKSSQSPSAICSLPPVLSGGATCFASFRRWTYSVEKGRCDEIFFGGCFGTKNLFDTFEDCKRACGGGALG